MKLITILTTLLLSTTALACPNLVGTYTCSQHQDTYTMTMDQYESNGVTVYVVDGTEMPADGQWRNIQDPRQPDAEGNLSCVNDSLKYDMKGSLYDENKNVIGDMTLTAMLVLQGKQLNITMNGLANVDGQQHQLNDAYSCIKN